MGTLRFLVASKLDLYKQYGLKVDLQFFSDPALVPPGVASGGLDGAMFTYDQVLGGVAQGFDYKVVMPIDFSNGGDAIVASTNINSVADFKGKTVGYSRLAAADYLLQYALEQNGLSESDIKPVNVDGDNVAGAMASGSMEIGVTYQPNVDRIVSMSGDKFHVVYSSKQAPGLITDVLTFKASYIAKKPGVVKGVMQGYLAGLDYMKTHPEESAKIIADTLGITPEEAKLQLQDTYNMPLEEMPKSFEKNDSTTSFYGSGAIIGRLLLNSKQIKAVPDIADTLDMAILQELLPK
ncbi:ABC transporter substrate-binding protein [Pseudomonas sp. PS1]|uniref:ABC transporter substrate-binding protein n=1 Tax=Stutzerimonas marianensis TaxID=2929513 RepID=A0A9X2ARA0_9GAMM|nr:ABC transporter substrate-binding protein [Pseudomonas marianensis]MCJ0973218.1 ABC transporter substrate-binding protein [Pseudomonas marianensis]